MPLPEEVKKRLIAARRKRLLTAGEYVSGIEKGDRFILSRAITLVESTKEEHRALAREIISKCLSLSGNAFRVGITGVPGVGKSTFIESLGKHVIAGGSKLAVLTIDPTSNVTGGSILGDKTRMEELSADERAFIRPSPAGDSLGGVARKTREVMILCEAAGFDTIFVETVGVGQSETAVHSMTDFFLLLLLPGGGDELQGIKRGIVEMADAIAVNKADAQPAAAKEAKRAYRNAVHLFPAKESGWPVRTFLCSALQREGLDKIWQELRRYRSQSKENGYFELKRRTQALYWFEETIQERLGHAFRKHPAVANKMPELADAVVAGQITPFEAADDLLKLFL